MRHIFCIFAKKEMRTVLYPVFVAVIGLNLCLPMQAQKKDFRDPGFKGSVAISLQNGVMESASAWGPGIEVSLGNMFNRNHYLGASIEFLSYFKALPHLAQTKISVDYVAYLFSRNNTPVLGLNLGSGILTPDFKGFQPYSLFLHPAIGWSWMLPSGKGLMLNVGVTLSHPLFERDSGQTPWLQAFPRIAFAYEF